MDTWGRCLTSGEGSWGRKRFTFSQFASNPGGEPQPCSRFAGAERSFSTVRAKQRTVSRENADARPMWRDAVENAGDLRGGFIRC